MRSSKILFILAFLLVHAGPIWASESLVTGVASDSSYRTIEDGSESAIFPVANVRVDVEDPGRLLEYYTEILPIGSTTTDALAVHHRITRGQICEDPMGVLSVDGVGNYRAGSYWVVSVNGDYVNTNSHTQLRSGDNVKWEHLVTE